MLENDILKNTIWQIEGAYTPSTIHAYWAGVETFIKFCHSHELEGIPAQYSGICLLIEHSTEKPQRSKYSLN